MGYPRVLPPLPTFRTFGHVIASIGRSCLLLGLPQYYRDLDMRAALQTLLVNSDGWSLHVYDGTLVITNDTPSTQTLISIVSLVM